MTRSQRSGPVSRISAKKPLRRSWTTILKKMLDTYTGKVKLAYMREALTGSAPADSRVIRPFEQLKRLEQAQKTEELVQAVDWFYNQMVDPTFEKRVGDLEKVLSVSTEELSGFDWQDFLEEEAAEDAYRRMQHQLADAMTSFLRRKSKKRNRSKRAVRR